MADRHQGSKTCATCGRTITWRKKWERDWDNVRHCSDGCRKHRVTDTDRKLEAETLRLLAERGAGLTICPSEAARAVAGDDEEKWRPLMERARMAARRLAQAGQVVITQHGKTVDSESFRGPIRVRKK